MPTHKVSQPPTTARATHQAFQCTVYININRINIEESAKILMLRGLDLESAAIYPTACETNEEYPVAIEFAFVDLRIPILKCRRKRGKTF